MMQIYDTIIVWLRAKYLCYIHCHTCSENNRLQPFFDLGVGFICEGRKHTYGGTSDISHLVWYKMKIYNKPVLNIPDEIRVFISSTFRDMQHMRDHLVKKVFPQLRHTCHSYGLEFTEVDLRWGITDEEAREGKVIEICLDEIERCKPYFIGIIGARYGWIPAKGDLMKNQKLINKYPCISEAASQELSVTEMEIVYGALNQSDMSNHVFFYFLSDDYISDCGIMEIGQEEKSRVNSLKKKIQQSGKPFRENIKDAEQLGELIYQDLWGSINESLPKDLAVKSADKRRGMHEYYSKSRLKGYVDNPSYLDKINKYIERSRHDMPFLITGESGSGKSALLAFWSEDHIEKNPSAFIIKYFIGVTGIDHYDIMVHIMEEIKTRYGLSEELPKTHEQIEQEFTCWLSRVGSEQLIIILDSVNRLEGNARSLYWLPRHIPQNIIWILSEVDTDHLAEDMRKGCEKLAVKPLSPSERKALIEKYLNIYRKSLSKDQLDIISHNELCSNPLFLRSLLEELRIFGEFEKLECRIAFYLQSKDISDLFMRILDRMEQDFNQQTVQLFTCLLHASRFGLTETELLDITGFSRLEMSRFLLSSEGHIVSRNGLLSFFHDYLKDAVEKKYLTEPAEAQTYHEQIIAYFQKRDINERTSIELPWQFLKLNQWNELQKLLTDKKMFQIIRSRSQYELLGYWRCTCSLHDMAEAYIKCLPEYLDHADDELVTLQFLNQLSTFFIDSGLYQYAERISRKAMKVIEWDTSLKRLTTTDAWIAKAIGDPIFDLYINELLSCGNILAVSLLHLNNYDEAQYLLESILEKVQKLNGAESMAALSFYSNLSKVYYEKCNFLKAEEMLKNIVHIREKWLGAQYMDTQNAYLDLAALYRRMAEYLKAEEIYLRVLENMSRLLDPDNPHLAGIYNNYALLLFNTYRFDEALNYHKMACRIREKVLGQGHPDTLESYLNISASLIANNQLEQAEEINEKLLPAAKAVYGEDHEFISKVYNNMATIYKDRFLHNEAEAAHRKAVRISEKVFGVEHLNTAKYYANLADHLNASGKHKEALALYKNVLDINIKLLGPNHPHTALSYNYIASVCINLADYSEAEHMYKKALDAIEKSGYIHPDTSTVYSNYAVLCYIMDMTSEAEAYWRKSIEIDKKFFGEYNIRSAETYNNLAAALCIRGSYDEAEKIHRAIIKCRESALGAYHPDTSVSYANLARVLSQTGRYEEAMKLYLKSIAIREKFYGTGNEDALNVYDELIKMLKESGRHFELEMLLRKVLRIKEEILHINKKDLIENYLDLADAVKANGDSAEAKRLYAMVQLFSSY